MGSTNSEKKKKSEGNRLAEKTEATLRKEQHSNVPMTHWATYVEKHTFTHTTVVPYLVNTNQYSELLDSY